MKVISNELLCVKKLKLIQLFAVMLELIFSSTLNPFYVHTNPSKYILSIDIGGSHVKATILDQTGKMINDYERVRTPPKPNPEQLLSTIQTVTKDLEQYDFISVGFPGFVKDGVVMTAPNLGTENWSGIDFRKMVEESLQKPTQLVNDADLQGLGVIDGKGLELVVTLGTGFGTALLWNGKLLPHLEMSQHPIHNDKNYDEYIGDKILKEKGDEKWNERMLEVLRVLKKVFNYDRLYIGGGNARHLTMTLDKNIIVINNREGIKGGARLWFPLATNNN